MLYQAELHPEIGESRRAAESRRLRGGPRSVLKRSSGSNGKRPEARTFKYLRPVTGVLRDGVAVTCGPITKIAGTRKRGSRG